MQSTPKSYGVIFDLDGVLIDSADLHFQSWKRLAAELGRDLTREQFQRTFGRQNRDIIPIQFGESDPDRIQTLADRKESIYRDLVRDEPPIVPGAVELVQSLSDNGVRLAIGSSAPRENIELVLAAMNIRHLMKTIVSGDDVTRGKPDPEVFTCGCEGLELPPNRCVVIEDAPAGIAAARSAGTQAIAVLMHHPPEAMWEANLIVKELGDLAVAIIKDLIDEGRA